MLQVFHVTFVSFFDSQRSSFVCWLRHIELYCFAVDFAAQAKAFEIGVGFRQAKFLLIFELDLRREIKTVSDNWIWVNKTRLWTEKCYQETKMVWTDMSQHAAGK